MVLLAGISATQKDLRDYTEQFRDPKDSRNEKKRIEAAAAAELQKLISDNDKINQRADDTYQFMIHRQINKKKEQYRKLGVNNALDIKQKTKARTTLDFKKIDNELDIPHTRILEAIDNLDSARFTQSVRKMCTKSNRRDIHHPHKMINLT